MSKPKIGDKYIIEIDSHMTNKNGDLYGVKGFNSLVFDQNGLDKMTRLEEDAFYLHVGDEVVDKEGNTAYVLVPRYQDVRQALLLMRDYAYPQLAWRVDLRKTGHSEALEFAVRASYASLVGENEEGEQ